LIDFIYFQHEIFFGEPLSSKISLEHGKIFHNTASFIVSYTVFYLREIFN